MSALTPDTTTAIRVIDGLSIDEARDALLNLLGTSESATLAALRNVQIIRIKQTLRPLKLHRPPLPPADVYTDAEYRDERAEVNA